MTKTTILTIITIALLLAGCTEQAKQPVWGKGELEPDYVRYFGTDNTARLNKAQNDLLNKHNAVLHGIDQTTDGKTAHTNGIIDLLFALEGRVKALEAVDPNEVKWREGVDERIGELDCFDCVTATEIDPGFWHEIE